VEPQYNNSSSNRAFSIPQLGAEKLLIASFVRQQRANAFHRDKRNITSKAFPAHKLRKHEKKKKKNKLLSEFYFIFC